MASINCTEIWTTIRHNYNDRSIGRTVDSIDGWQKSWWRGISDPITRATNDLLIRRRHSGNQNDRRRSSPAFGWSELSPFES